MDDTVAKVLRMNVIEEKAVSEIAEELQMNYKAAENRLQTGRRQLRNYMKKAI
jgi:DNA-directed RNA polymerase specialized sigma24 family protein